MSKKLEQFVHLAMEISRSQAAEAQASKQEARLWKVARWTAERYWRAPAGGARKQILMRLCLSVNDALKALDELRALDEKTSDEVPAPAAAMPVVNERKHEEGEERLAPKTHEEAGQLCGAVINGGVKA